MALKEEELEKYFPFITDAKRKTLLEYFGKEIEALGKTGRLYNLFKTSPAAKIKQNLPSFEPDLVKMDFGEQDFTYFLEEVKLIDSHNHEARIKLHARKIAEIVGRDSSVAKELREMLSQERSVGKEAVETPTIDILQGILETGSYRTSPAMKAKKILELLSVKIREELGKILAHSPSEESGDFLVLHNIACYGSDGKPFEQYDQILVAKDIVRKKDGSFVSFSPYQAIEHFEKGVNGLFLPSFALQCAILVELYKNRENPEFAKVLQQYKDYGPGYGGHNNNTIVDGKNGVIIHYPRDGDFPSHGGTADINKAMQKIEKSFPKKMNRDNSSFEDVLKNATKASYTKDLTGLKNPRILIDIATYFGKTAWSYPADNSVCSAWLGCLSGSGFYVYSYDTLCSYDAARGVRRQ